MNPLKLIVPALLLCACGDKSDEDDSGGIALQAPLDLAGDWEGTCTLEGLTLTVDLVINQTNYDLTGWADLWFNQDDKLHEYTGEITGSATIEDAQLALEYETYGKVTAAVTLNETPDGDLLLGTCYAPDGASGDFTVSR